MPGTSADNDHWIRAQDPDRVQRFGQATYDIWRLHVADDDPIPFLTAFGMSPERYFPGRRSGAHPGSRARWSASWQCPGWDRPKTSDLAVDALRRLDEQDAAR